MEASYLIGLLLVALSVLKPRGIRRPAWLRGISPIRGTLALCIALCVLFAAHVRLVHETAQHFTSLSPLGHRLPIPALGMGFLFQANFDPHHAALLELVELGESLCLLLLAGVLRSNARMPRGGDTMLAMSALVLAALAVCAPGMESGDLYSYIGLAQATPTPYDPAAIVLPGDNAIVNRVWGLPLTPSPYGPLWWLISHALTSPSRTLRAELIALRVLELLALAALLVCLKALGHSRRTLALVAVNPALYDMFVMEGHNDLLAASFVFAAAVAVRKRLTPLAVFLAACAGAIKLPFLLVAFLVFLPEPTVARRIRLGCAAAFLTVISIQCSVGAPYWLALRRVIALYPTAPTPLETTLQTLLALTALGAIAWAIFARRLLPGAVWAYPALGRFALPQYLAWSLPHALLGKRPHLVFLAALPSAIYVLSPDDAVTPLFIATRAILVAVPTMLIARALLARWRSIT